MHNNSYITKKGDRIKNMEKKGLQNIFSKEEINSTIKGFALVWLRDQVKIHFTLVDELIKRAKLEGKN